METFSSSPPINLIEEGKWLLAVTSFEATKSVFNITNENISFSFIIPGHWTNEDDEELINELNKIIKLRSENDIELQVKEVEKRGTRIEIENSASKLAGFDNSKSEGLSELKRVKYRDLEDLVYRLQITYDEVVDILNVEYKAGSTIGYILPPGVFKINDFNLILKSLLPNEVKMKNTIDDIRLNQT